MPIFLKRVTFNVMQFVVGYNFTAGLIQSTSYATGNVTATGGNGGIGGNGGSGGTGGAGGTLAGGDGGASAAAGNGGAGSVLYAGGLVGANITTGSFNTCFATGIVSATGGAGALGGSGGQGGNGGAGGSGVTGAGGDGKVGSTGGTGGAGGDIYGGGLAGQNTGTITNAYARGNVTVTAGTSSIGGSGGNGGSAGGGAAGSGANGGNGGAGGAGADAYAGGLLGSNNTATITNAYATGAPSATNTSAGAGGAGGSAGTPGGSAGAQGATGAASVSYAAGLVGNHLGGAYSSTYWDTTTSGKSRGAGNGGSDPLGMLGQATDLMKQQATFSGWDFTTVPVWNITEGVTYPYFYTQDLVSGIVYTNKNHTTPLTGARIVLAINGAVYDAYTTTNPGGNYYLLAGSFKTGDTLLIYIDNNGVQGNTATIAGTTNISGLDIYGGTVIARYDSGSSITNANFSTAKGSQSDTDILYAMNGAILDVGSGLYIWTGKTFAPAANVEVSGDWDNYGVFTSGTNMVTFDGSGAQAITSNGTDGNHDFYNLTVTNASVAGVTFADSCAVTGTFTDTTGDSKLTFNSGSTYAFTNININGAAGHPITLASSGTWYFNVPQLSPAVSYVAVDHSDASGGNQIDARNNGVDNNGNTNWFFIGPLSYFVVSGITDPVTAGSTTSPQVTAYDTYGNIKTNYTGTIHFSSDDSQAVLPNDYAFIAGDNGTHTFTNEVTLKTTGDKYVKAADGLSTGQQSSITVNPAAPYKLNYLQQPTNAEAAATITPAITAEIRDQYNNLCVNDNTTVVNITIESSPGSGALSGNMNKAASGGVVTFNDLSINQAGVGYTLKVSSGVLTTAVSNSFSITTPNVATWTGAVSTDWNTAGNWDIGRVPGAADTIVIPDTAREPECDNDVTMEDLTVNIGQILSTGGYTFTVKNDIKLFGRIAATNSTINVGGNLTTNSPGIISGTNVTLTVGGYIGTVGHPINLDITGAISIRADGMHDFVSVYLTGAGNFSYASSIPGFVFMNGNLVSNAGQASIRSRLATGESVAYRGAPVMRPIGAVSAPMMIMAPVVTPMGMVTPMVVSAAPMPQAITVAVPVLAPSPAISVPSPKVTPVLPAGLLFKGASVSAEVMPLSPPQAFQDIRVYVNLPLGYFRDATIAASISGIITPDIFSNIKVFSQIL